MNRDEYDGLVNALSLILFTILDEVPGFICERMAIEILKFLDDSEKKELRKELSQSLGNFEFGKARSITRKHYLKWFSKKGEEFMEKNYVEN